VVIGGSAGAFEPLRTLLSCLPANFPAPVLVTMHVPAGAQSTLPKLLTAAGPLPARHAQHGDALTPGAVLVAPPDRHLVVHDGVVHLSRGPKENRHRPAIDALFNSAARVYGPGVIGIVLSGSLDDGAAGAASIAAQDGVVLVQDPQDARVTSMPKAVIAAVRRARSAPADGLAALLIHLLTTPASSERPPVEESLEWESNNVNAGPIVPTKPPGEPAAVSCPECAGGMFQSAPAGQLHFVCHVGHSWSPESLIDAQREASEAALYSAAAKLVEEATVLRQLAAASRESGFQEEADKYERSANLAQERATQLQNMLRTQD
jgi:two-component system chemotaxis response regulator CheB